MTPKSALNHFSLDEKIQVLNFNICNNEGQNQLTQAEYSVDPVTHELVEIVEKKKPNKKGKYLRTQEFDIVTVLQEHVLGHALLDYYDRCEQFDSLHQHYILDIFEDILASSLLKVYRE